MFQFPNLKQIVLSFLASDMKIPTKQTDLDIAHAAYGNTLRTHRTSWDCNHGKHCLFIHYLASYFVAIDDSDKYENNKQFYVQLLLQKV